jgi:hypothetical protein
MKNGEKLTKIFLGTQPEYTVVGFSFSSYGVVVLKITIQQCLLCF